MNILNQIWSLQVLQGIHNIYYINKTGFPFFHFNYDLCKKINDELDIPRQWTMGMTFENPLLKCKFKTTTPKKNKQQTADRKNKKGISKYFCPICGVNFKTIPYHRDGTNGTWYFCESCGFDRVALYEHGSFLKYINEPDISEFRGYSKGYLDYQDVEDN
jgi:predicted RNA-binding Zn-ribbon protein involved in translation (DUF1610 family)